MITELFVLLVLVHFIADFAFQSEFMAKYKQESWVVMSIHSFIWSGCVFLALMWYKDFKHLASVPNGWIVGPWLLYCGHYFMDTLKCELLKIDPWKNHVKALFHTDQVFHLVQLLIVACIYG